MTPTHKRAWDNIVRYRKREKPMTPTEAIETIKRVGGQIDDEVARMDAIDELLDAARALIVAYEHSEWLRVRAGAAYARVGDEVV